MKCRSVTSEATPKMAHRLCMELRCVFLFLCMVVKPLQFVTRNRRGLVQPAVKCRGGDYLRIIYGPEYTAPDHLERLRARGFGTKRSLALREFA